MSLETDIQKLKSLRSQAAELLEKIQSKRAQNLAGIHEAHGFETVEKYNTAVRAARGSGTASRKRRGRPRTNAAPSPALAQAGKQSGRKRGRAKITPEMKDQLKGMVKDGKTGNEVAKAPGIPLPSVHNVKKQLGLTKTRS